jgi:glucose-6-phosphate isomerase
MKSKVIKFDLKTGLSDTKKALQRHASQMEGMYFDNNALGALIQDGDPLIYEFYDMGIKETESNLAYGTSMVFPGKVGDEFFMTKGHFHTILDTSEIYYCLSGFGMMLMESPEGDIEYQLMRPGDAVFVPGRYAHRSINLSLTEKLVTFFVFRADAGHDYGSIEGKSFRKLILDDGKGGFKVIDNPKWGESK